MPHLRHSLRSSQPLATEQLLDSKKNHLRVEACRRARGVEAREPSLILTSEPRGK